MLAGKPAQIPQTTSREAFGQVAHQTPSLPSGHPKPHSWRPGREGRHHDATTRRQTPGPESEGSVTAAAIEFRTAKEERITGLVFLTEDNGLRLRKEVDVLKGFKIEFCEDATLEQLRDKLNELLAQKARAA